MKQRILRLWRVLPFALALGLFAFLPNAFAAPTINFNAVPEAAYTVYQGGTYDVVIDLTEYLEDTSVEFYVKGPIGETSEEEKLIETYEYITNEQHTFSWDGKFDGAYTQPGNFELRLEGQDLFANPTNILTHSFTVSEEANMVVNNAPATHMVTSPGDYKISFSLETVADVCLVLRVNEEIVFTGSPLGTGDHIATWNGELGGSEAAEGDYPWRMYADPAYCGPTEAEVAEFASGTVAVTQEVAPVISGLAMTIDPFSPNEDGNQDTTTVTFSLDQDADVTVAVVNDADVELKKLKDADPVSAGTVNVVWDGRESGGSIMPDGVYTVVVDATNGAGADMQEVSIEVRTTEEEEGEEQCAGYSDISADDPNCKAIEYVQSIGAMTGHPDGTFRSDEILQRDQVAKISLETFGLFNDAEDYCTDGDPFPDVTSEAWSYQYICRGVDLEMVKGYQSGDDAGKYVPGRSVNRVEFLALILRNLGEEMPSMESTSYDDVPAGQWFSGYAKYSLDTSLFVGNNLNPTQLVTRAEVADVLLKLNELGKI